VSEVTERDIVGELAAAEIERCCAELGECRTDEAKRRWLKRSIAKHDIVIGFWPDVDGWSYFIIKGEDAVFSLLYVAQAAGGGWRANHGFTTAAVPCLDKEDARGVQLSYTACDGKAKLAKLFDALPAEEGDALKVEYGLVSVQ
jgi:hypothetical protein